MKEQGNIIHGQEKNWLVETEPQMTQMLELVHKDFKKYNLF